MSTFPVAQDVLDAEVACAPLPDIAAQLGLSVTRVHQLLRDRQLLAVRRDGVVQVPLRQLAEDNSGVTRFLPGVLTLLSDGGFSDEEALRYLFTADESLPGRPIDALHGHLAREVRRRAQALAF